MDIKRTPPQRTGPADSPQLDSKRAAEAHKPELAPAAVPAREAKGARTDSVNVSAEAKALVEGSESRTSGSGLSAERLKEIGERLATGHYDRPEVVDQVARRVARDADIRITE